MNIETLHDFEKNTTVGVILSSFYNVVSKNDLLNSIEDDVNGMFGYWAYTNNLSPSELFDLIDYKLNDTASFIGSKEPSKLDGLLNLGNDVILKLQW